MAAPAKRVGDDPSVHRPEALDRALDRAGAVLDWLWRARGEDLHHLGGDEPALFVGNHSGGPLALFEPLLLAHLARRAGVALAMLPFLLLHEIMWRTPLASLLARLGAVRASPDNANAILASGGRVLVYPGGDREPFRAFRHRDRIALGDRRGYVKLAIRHGVPIVPVVTTGLQSGFVCLSDGRALAERFPLARFFRVGVLPITLSFPFGLWLGVPPPYVPLFVRARVRALPPIRLTRAGEEAARDEAYVEACHRIVVHAMQRALDALARERRHARRADLHRALDAGLDLVERWTGVSYPAVEEPARVAAPLPLPPRRSRPSRPPARAA
jgi:1-acyl-sn-glycerol-3-phosphate acyltransferase